MPIYDRLCPACNTKLLDRLEPINASVVPCPDCGSPTERAWLTKPANVVGDECDITIEHGLCDPVTAEPVRYTSKAEIAREAKKRGLVNVVRHIPERGSDKSPHTTNWAAGIDPQTLDNVRELLSRSSKNGSKPEPTLSAARQERRAHAAAIAREILNN